MWVGALRFVRVEEVHSTFSTVSYKTLWSATFQNYLTKQRLLPAKLGPREKWVYSRLVSPYNTNIEQTQTYVNALSGIRRRSRCLVGKV